MNVIRDTASYSISCVSFCLFGQYLSMYKYFKNTCLILCSAVGITTMDTRSAPPQATISNRLVKVQLYLPDAQNGYYRGTRFDWSGVISSLQHDGHEYHGKWFEIYDAKNHDAIMGPVEEFGPLGYDEAKPGETFVKIGVGRLIKPVERQYAFSKRYTLSDAGKWQTSRKATQIIFKHTLADEKYGYAYQKTVMLTKGKAEMVLLHKLTNKGKRTINTTVYNHNFFVIDRQPTGAGYVISFPVNNLSAAGSKGLGEVVTLKDKSIVYLRSLKKGEQGYFPDLTAGVEMPYNIKVEHTGSGAGVNIKGDRPVAKMVYWSSPTTVSPEPYINVKVEPGKTFTWKIAYEYYTIPTKN
jgi:hypothetical protein